MVTSCLELLRNPTYIFLILYGASDAFIVTAFTTFGPKYVEIQYGVSAGFAGILFGTLYYYNTTICYTTKIYTVLHYRPTTILLQYYYNLYYIILCYATLY